MTQTRVCSYFESDCKHVSREPKTFLTLPEHVRHQVYLQAGFVRDAHIRVQLKDGMGFLSAGYHSWPQQKSMFEAITYSTRNGLPVYCFSNLHPDECKTYLDLRLVSREINVDVMRCLCSNNTFQLYAEDVTSNAFDVLVKSPLGLLSRLKRLSILLDHKTFEQIANPSTLKNTTFSWKPETFLPAWKKLVRVLSQSPHSSKLGLLLSCYMNDLTTAKLIMKPLEQLRLAKFALRPFAKLNSEIENIVHETIILSTTPGIHTQDKFRFLDLPTELRQHILSFTDLVAPDREIEWSPYTGFDLKDRCTRRNNPCSEGFCNTQSLLFPPCACWQPPISTFLVCHTILRDARKIFYASNRFIENSTIWHDPEDGKKKRFAASMFLTQAIPWDGLASLRILEIHFDRNSNYALRNDKTVFEDWENAIQYAGPRLRRLTLYVHMREWSGPDLYQLSDEGIKASLQEVLPVHEQIVRPLSQLRCLDGFFVLLGKDPDFTQWARASVQRDLNEHRERLELLVLGNTSQDIARRKLTENCKFTFRLLPSRQNMFRNAMRTKQIQRPPQNGLLFNLVD